MQQKILSLCFILGCMAPLSAQVISVTDYGALPADDPAHADTDTDAFIDAIFALKATGGTLLVPAGVYHINRPIVLPENDLDCSVAGTPSEPIILQGEGREVSMLIATANFDFVQQPRPNYPLEPAVIYLFGGSTVHDLTIHGTWDQTAAQDSSCYGFDPNPSGCPDLASGVSGIKLASSNNVVENISIRYCRKALDVSFTDFGGTHYNQFSDVFAYYNGFGLYMETPLQDRNDCEVSGSTSCTECPSGGATPCDCDESLQPKCGSKFLNNCTAGLNFANVNTFTNLNVNYSHADGIRIDGGNGNTFTGGSVEVNRHGIRILDGASNNFLGMWIEKNHRGNLIQETLTTKTLSGALEDAPVNCTSILTNSIISDYVSKQVLRADVTAGNPVVTLTNVPANFMPVDNQDSVGPFYRGKPVVVDGGGSSGALFTWILDFDLGSAANSVDLTLAHTPQTSRTNTKLRFGVP